jgi:hypothetical protein
MADKPVAIRSTKGMSAMTTYLSMFSKSVLALTLAAAAIGAHAASRSTSPHTGAVQRFHTVVTNPNFSFRDIQIAGRVYTVEAHKSLAITAPAGTPIYAADNMSSRHAKGSLLAEVAPRDQTITLQ